MEGRQKTRFSFEDLWDTVGSWGLVSGEPTEADRKKELWTYSWTSNPRTLKMPGAVNVASEYVYFDGTRWWYVDGEYELLRAKRPILRRLPQKGGTVIPEIQAMKQAQGVKDDSALEARYPPMLRSQGAKTQPDWLFEFIKAPYPIRPNLQPIYPGARSMPDVNFRMPTFGFTDDEAWAIVKFFWTRDALKDEVYPHTEFPMRDEAYIRERLAGWKEKDIPFIMKNCVECHFVNGSQPTGTDEGTYKFAPELAEVHKRLRPRWTDRWLEHPAWIYPRTTMTEWYPKPEDRKAGLDVLMNWPKPPIGAKGPE
jgi:hypothetical protein